MPSRINKEINEKINIGIGKQMNEKSDRQINKQKTQLVAVEGFGQELIISYIISLFARLCYRLAVCCCLQWRHKYLN